jgi:hypothetical protein
MYRVIKRTTEARMVQLEESCCSERTWALKLKNFQCYKLLRGNSWWRRSRLEKA